MNSKSRIAAFAVFLAAVVAGLLIIGPRSEPAAAALPAPASTEVAEPAITVPFASPLPAGKESAAATVARATPPSNQRAELPPVGTNAKRRVLAHGTFGKRPDQFARVEGEAENFPPQGFVLTRDGRLLVLDTGKQRLVTYGQDGHMENEVPLPPGSLVLPADVAIANDGTIAVIDYPGLQTQGTLLLDAKGNKKGEIKQLDVTVAGLYAAGDDFYVNIDGLSSIKLADSKGNEDDLTPKVAQEEDGRIAGHVAPDGTTVLRLSIEDRDQGHFTISSTRGSPGREVFTRFYRYLGVFAIKFLQADTAGRIYMVLNMTGRMALVCLDGSNGDPVGMVELPFPIHDNTVLHRYSVAPQGGLVAATATDTDMTYEWFNCHP